MAIEILEIHHTGVRIDTGAQKLAATETFYKDVLGLERDVKRPTIPGINNSGISAAMSEAVMAMIVKPTWRAPIRVAWSGGCPAFW